MEAWIIERIRQERRRERRSEEARRLPLHVPPPSAEGRGGERPREEEPAERGVWIVEL
ncbi:hypothetical protein L6R50_25905 [Myxococcota bacterium]|nr:hypothetical protein [Myxococcota bacterium]